MSVDDDSLDLRNSLGGQAGLLSELLAITIEPVLEINGLTMSAFELLSSVRSAGKSATQAELARRLDIAPPSLSEAIVAAECAGLVKREPLPGDARAKRVVLTAKGIRSLNNVIKAMNLAESAMVKGIGMEELRTAIQTLKTANRYLARALSSP